MNLPTGFPGYSRRPPGDPNLNTRDQRLEALKAVAGKLAHDFNNFLAPQCGYLTMIKEEAPPGSTLALYLDAMNAAVEKAGNHVSSILLGMRPYRQFSPREFALDALVNELLDAWMAQTSPANPVVVNRHLESFAYFGDEKQWRSALEELLANARLALAMGGTLDVTLKRERIPGSEVSRLGLPSDDVFRLQVQDTGFGMPPAVLQRAFDPFFTTRTQVKAAGLGLTLVHGITQYHAGQVELASEEDRGTTVTVWLPAAPIRSREGISSRGLTPPGRKKVVLVEDDPLIREVLRTWLAALGFEVDCAATERETRRALERGGSDCMMVLCETDLPSIRGEDLYVRLREAFPNREWVFLRGSRVPDFGAFQPGEEPLVLQKPLTHAALAKVMGSYTDGP